MKELFCSIMLMVLLSGTAWAKPRVVLEAAHGGNDPGVRAGREVEKDWNLKVAQALQKAFEDSGFDVVMIRKGDSTVTPEKRVEMINTSQASAAVILHADREWTGVQKGPCFIVEPPSRGEGSENSEIQKWGLITGSQYRASLRMARAIAQSLGVGLEFSSLSDSRGLAGETPSADGRIFCLPHQSLRYLTLPSIVLTPLFLTSASDVKKFSRGDNLADLAAKVVQGMSEYLQITP